MIAAAKRPGTAGATPSGKRFVVYTSAAWVLGRTPEPAAEDAPLNPIPLVSWRAEHEELVDRTRHGQAVYEAVRGNAPARYVTLPGRHFEIYDRFYPDASRLARDWFLSHLTP